MRCYLKIKKKGLRCFALGKEKAKVHRLAVLQHF